MVETVLSVVLQHHNRLFRETLAARLAREPDLALAGMAATRPELARLCELCRPAVALFEVDRPGWGDEPLLPPGRATRMIGLHKSLPTAQMVRAAEAGVCALVPYSGGIEALLAAIRGPGRQGRSGLRVVLVGRAGPAIERVRGVLETRSGVAVFRSDELPEGNGDSGVTVLVDSQPASWHAGLVVVLTGEPERQLVGHALWHGATVLPQSLVDSLLIPAVEAANAGYLLIGSAYSRAVLDAPDGRRPALTPREKEILAAIARGQTTRQTARQLGISVRTAENLQGNLFRKLRVHTKAAALAAAHELGLLAE